MATEEQKKANLVRLVRMTLFGLTAGIWDMLGEGAFGLSHQIGTQLLPVLENEMGLEIAGEEPKDVLQEVGRLMVDEFGFATEVDVTEDGDRLIMRVHECVNRKFTDDLVKVGLTSPFICPYMCVSNAVFDRMGIKVMSKVAKWVEGKGSIITFELF